MNNKGSFGKVFMWIFVFVIGSLIVSFIVYPESFQSFKSNVQNFVTGLSVNSLSNPQISFTSIKDLHQNPQTYVEKNVTIKGMLNRRVGGYSLEDSGGYWIWIGLDSYGESCIEKQRDYDYNSKTYIAKGFLLPPKPCSYICFGFGEGHYYFECSEPLS